METVTKTCGCSQDPWDWKAWPSAKKSCPRCFHSRDEHIAEIVTPKCERRPCTRKVAHRVFA